MSRIGILEDRLGYAKNLATIIEIELGNQSLAAEIETFGGVDAAMAALDSHTDWVIWVVDLMMPTGESVSAADAENGLSTGTRFIERLLDRELEHLIEITVVTSRSTEKDNFQEKSNMITEFQKSEFTQVDIAKHVCRSIKG